MFDVFRLYIKLIVLYCITFKYSNNNRFDVISISTFFFVLTNESHNNILHWRRGDPSNEGECKFLGVDRTVKGQVLGDVPESFRNYHAKNKHFGFKAHSYILD